MKEKPVLLVSSGGGSGDLSISSTVGSVPEFHLWSQKYFPGNRGFWDLVNRLVTVFLQHWGLTNGQEMEEKTTGSKKNLQNNENYFKINFRDS